MIFEHFALNIKNPVEMAEWYVENFKMKIVRSMNKQPFTHFIADKTGRVVMEIYANPSAEFLDGEKHPLEFHFAFMVDDPQSLKEKLIKSGAKLEEDLHLDDGSNLIMLRDPFGVCVQLCKRGKPMMKF